MNMTASLRESLATAGRRSWFGTGALLCMVAALGAPLVIGGCKGESPGAAAESNEAGARVVHFKVEGLHCDGCAATARNAISKVDGVRRCDVSYKNASAEVVLDPDADDEIIARIIEEVVEKGFTIEQSES